MTNKSEPAFPTHLERQFMVSEDGKTTIPLPLQYAGGLTKREYFAAMAMQGIIGLQGEYSSHFEQYTPSFIAMQAAEIADALIEELNK